MNFYIYFRQTFAHLVSNICANVFANELDPILYRILNKFTSSETFVQMFASQMCTSLQIICQTTYFGKQTHRRHYIACYTPKSYIIRSRKRIIPFCILLLTNSGPFVVFFYKNTLQKMSRQIVYIFSNVYFIFSIKYTRKKSRMVPFSFLE